MYHNTNVKRTEFFREEPNFEASMVDTTDNRGHNMLDTYCMEFSMREMVRKAARLAVYEEMTIRANIHQTPIIILVARVV